MYIENPIFKETDLREYLTQTKEVGAAHIPSFLSDTTVSELKYTCSLLDYEKIEEQHENVKERYFIAQRNTLSEIIGIGLSTLFKERIFEYQSQFPTLQDWFPNDIAIQMYDRKSYITSHRDHRLNRGLIAVFTIQGQADFEISKERFGEPISKWRISAGDLVLLRASGFNTEIQDHPGIFHTVSGALTRKPRISISLRDKRDI